MRKHSDSRFWIFAYEVCYRLGFFRPTYSKRFIEFHERLQQKFLGGDVCHEEKTKKEEKNKEEKAQEEALAPINPVLPPALQ